MAHDNPQRTFRTCGDKAKWVQRFCSWRCKFIAVLALAVSVINRGLAQETFFFDDFDGPTLNTIWSGPLPPNSYNGAPFTGAPSYGFQAVTTNTVLRLSNLLSNERRGWSADTNFSAAQFRYEVRFSSVVPQTYPDSSGYFLEMWVLNATNSSYYDMVSLAGGVFSSSHYKFLAVSTVTSNNYNVGFSNFSSNTWYRLVIEGSSQDNLRGDWLTDAGQEIYSYTFGHNAAAFASGFRIAISQSWISTGPPPGTADVAVDSVQLSGTDAPHVVIGMVDAGTVGIGWQTLANRQYQVQCCSGFSSNGWSDFGARIQGTGDFKQVTDAVTNTARFYRVITSR